MSESAAETLREFYKWVYSVMDDDPAGLLNRNVGLCHNLRYWMAQRKYTAVEIRAAYMELEAQFVAAGLDAMYPFGMHDYHDRCAFRSIFLCPKRRAWIKEHANAE